jgi:hypothetical protein
LATYQEPGQETREGIVLRFTDPPPGSASRRENQPSTTGIPSAKRVKIRYGPYMVPNSNRKNLMGLNGKLTTYPHNDMEKYVFEFLSKELFVN